MKKIIVLTMLVISALGFAKEVNIKILGTSDVHGHVVPWNYQIDEFDDSGSYSQIAKMVDGYRKGNKRNYGQHNYVDKSSKIMYN